MSIRNLAVLVAIPLLWSSVALAQTPPLPPPPGSERMAPPSGEQTPASRAEWHKKMVTEVYAQHLAHLAYLEAKLNLTEKQHAAWNKWKQAVIETATKERDTALENPPKGDAPPTILDHQAQFERILTLKLQGLQAERPSLQALYEVLTPEQKALLDHPHHGHHEGGFGPEGFEHHHPE
jgi:hypothetical protein